MTSAANVDVSPVIEPIDRRSNWTYRLVLLALMAAELTCSLESNMIYVILSPLYEEYGDPVFVNWMLTAFMLTSFGAAAIVGRLGDVFGRRRMMMVMLVVAAFGSMLSALSNDLIIVIVGRAFQGATMGILPLCYGVLRQVCDEDRATRGITLLGAVYVAGSGAGMILGGLIVNWFNWQWIFILSAGMSVVALGLVWLFVPRIAPTPSKSSLDTLGLTLFVLAIGMILAALSWPRGIVAAPEVVLPLLVGGICCSIVWLRHELRHPEPFIDVRLLLERPILLANLCIFFTAIGPMMHPIIMMPFLQQPLWTGTGLGVPAASVGLVKLPSTAVQFVGLIALGYLATRFSTRLALIGAALALVSGWLIMVFSHDSLWVVGAVYIVLLAPGGVMMFTMIPRLIMAAVPEQRTSEATGLTQSFRALGQTFSAQLMGFLLATSMVSRPNISGAFPSDSAFTLTFVAMVILSLAALVVLLLMRTPAGPPAHHDQPEPRMGSTPSVSSRSPQT